MNWLADSTLTLTVVSPKSTRTFSELSREQWETLWTMFHSDNRKFGRDVPPDSERAAEKFALALVKLPRRTTVASLSVEQVIELARGEVANALEATSGDRQTLGERVNARTEKHRDNRLNGRWQNGRD